MENVSVLGFGSWGIALATLLQRNGNNVTIWARSEQKLRYARSIGHADEYLTNINISREIRLTSDMARAAESDIVVFAVPSKATREIAENIGPYLWQGQTLVSAAKGFEENTLMRLSEVLRESAPHCDVVVFSGPGHAEEVAVGLPTTYVAAADNIAAAKRVQNIFMSDSFRVYTQSDVVGAELGGAIKNVIALAAGISDGMGYGDNARAALITRGLAEISRLGVAMGADPLTFAGLTGIGDLVVTCTSLLSRNRRCGMLLGQGKSLEDALNEVHTVVEGVATAKSAMDLAIKYGVDMPIVKEINETLFNGKAPTKAVLDLMTRDKTNERR